MPANRSPTPEPFGAMNARLAPRAHHGDQTVAWIAGRQHGAVSRAQLLKTGMSRHAIDRRLAHGSLRALYPGVFVVAGAPVTALGSRTAALLACPAGVLSHRTAAEHLGLLPERPGPVHVTSAGRHQSRPGLQHHRSRSVGTATVTRMGLPCTSLPRTLVDLAATLPPVAVRRAWTTAASRRLVRPQQIDRELRDHPNRPGSRVVRSLLAEAEQVVRGRTRSELEAACIRMCHDHGLPTPQVNALIRVADTVFEADLAWPDVRLIVEVDSWRTHGHVEAFASDRARDFLLSAHGWRTVRLLEDAILRHPRTTAERLRRMLDA